MVGVMFLFGLSWIFGALTVRPVGDAFEVLFIIFNSTQGFFIFIFTCVFNQEIRQDWFNLFDSDGKNRIVMHRIPLKTLNDQTIESKSSKLEMRSFECATYSTMTEDEMDSEVPPQVRARWSWASNFTSEMELSSSL